MRKFTFGLIILGGVALTFSSCAPRSPSEPPAPDTIFEDPTGRNPAPTPSAGVGKLPSGAIYHEGTCTPASNEDKIVIFVPGTATTPGMYSTFIRTVGDQTGLCALSIPYENTITVGSCCGVSISEGEPPLFDPVCLDTVHRSKSYGVPSNHTCLNGKSYSVPPKNSVEGSIAATLSGLSLNNYYSLRGVDPMPRWEKIVLAGHSQGAELALFIGREGHLLSGIGALAVAGGFFELGALPYPLYVTQPQTRNSTQRVFHHVNDGDSYRQVIYSTLQIPSSNVRVSSNSTPECRKFPHQCIVMDFALPEEYDEFVDAWLWLIGE